MARGRASCAFLAISHEYVSFRYDANSLSTNSSSSTIKIRRSCSSAYSGSIDDSLIDDIAYVDPDGARRFSEFGFIRD